ncbi:piggyBac transposable element-derived protein 4-like [Schistocerca piceifrons]|uniref:piggyBac transposable element-derived protein 4-like n=4 Tax=Schistocerca piceifrons TaxID=274613 RepID=UPI001F5EE612|nr:piggyBac transposable element-derived protein 4-like [Schistocerca piceifrons]
MAMRPLNDRELEEIVNASPDEGSLSEFEDHISNASESECSDDSYDSPQPIQNSVETFLSKNGNIEWQLHPPAQHGRLPASNIIKSTPGVTRYAVSRISDVKCSFEAVFHTALQNEIIEMTNIEGQRVYGEQWTDIDGSVFHAYLGLLLLAGVYRSHGESTKSLWDKDTGRNIFRATMSHETFCKISRVLRFDKKSTREERRRTDKLAAIRSIWEKWVEVLPKLYNPGENVTVDEQLVAFRGRCPFKQYIPSKPAKYGIKIWTMCDSKTSYVLKAQIYTGKVSGAAPERNQGMRVVSDLTSELRGQNITCDNFFTSYNLGQLLLKRKLTMLGTIRKNKPELPHKMTNKEVHSSSFYFTNDTTVVNYIPKRHKNVVLMSTLHHDAEISDRADKKPKMILDYNSTKGAVDTLDQLLGTYTCKRKSNRWPMIVFYNILDVSAYNAYVLWISVDPNWNASKLTRRRIFLEELGKSLIKEHIASRTHFPRTEDSLRMVTSIQNPNDVGGVSESVTTRKSTKRARCKFCPSSNDNKTNMVCGKCSKHICKKHVTYLCPQCKQYWNRTTMSIAKTVPKFMFLKHFDMSGHIDPNSIYVKYHCFYD